MKTYLNNNVKTVIRLCYWSFQTQTTASPIWRNCCGRSVIRVRDKKIKGSERKEESETESRTVVKVVRVHEKTTMAILLSWHQWCDAHRRQNDKTQQKVLPKYMSLDQTRLSFYLPRTSGILSAYKWADILWIIQHKNEWHIKFYDIHICCGESFHRTKVTKHNP